MKLSNLVFILLSFVLIRPAIAWSEMTIHVMAPLTIGNIHQPDGEESSGAWSQFRQHLAELKEMGVDGVSTDVWWGAVEPQENRFQWAYYDKVFRLVREAGLKWVPILSFHQLGGNVGDSDNLPIPDYIWTKYIGQPGVTDENSLKSLSEQGNYNSEVVGPHATGIVISDYRRVMAAFQNRYGSYANYIAEINISLGPAGELRYPSYNSHDNAPYPSRGALQFYNPIWVQGFQESLRERYRSIETLNRQWGFSLESFEQAHPPADPNQFFANGEQFTPYGRSLFGYANSLLIEHSKLMLEEAFAEFDSPDSQFRGIDLGVKLPGMHWRMDFGRDLELGGGLIRPDDEEDWWLPENGYGYFNTLNALRILQNNFSRDSRLVVHFTALELDNGDGGEGVGSQAKALVFYIARIARRMGLVVKGENALPAPLESRRGWWNIEDAIEHGPYQGVTILRMESVLGSEAQRNGLRELLQFREAQCLRALRRRPFGQDYPER